MARAIFITGAGSGIGQATARFFAARGWRVGLADVRADGLAETAALLGDAAHIRHPMDVREPEAWAHALAAFAGAGPIDIVFNNAGVAAGGPIIDMTPAEIERTVSINLLGVLYGARAAYPYLKRADGGAALVSTSSAAGLYAGAGMSVYAATKFGVRAMTEALEREWAADGIAVRAIMPGFIDTPLLSATSSGSNRSIRETVAEAGLEFTPVEAVAQAVWDAAHGRRTHTLVGRTARRLHFATRWAPWLLPKGEALRAPPSPPPAATTVTD